MWALILSVVATLILKALADSARQQIAAGEKPGSVGIVLSHIFDNVQGWFVHIGRILYAPVTIQEQTVIVLAREIERIDDKVLKVRIQEAARAANVEGYLNTVVKTQVEEKP